MPATLAAPAVTPSDLAWRVIGLLNLYRLLVPMLLLAMQGLAGPPWTLVTAHPRLFVGACVAYFTAALLLVIARRLAWSSLRFVALVNASVDALAIAFILYAAGGVSSGLGILLVLPVLALGVLADRRDAVLIAAVAALAVLGQQVFAGVTDATPLTDYAYAGLLGAVLFGTSLATWPVAHRLRESDALVRRQELDLANLAQLSQYIVQHLRESILVIDTQDRIRLINESAAEILGDENAFPDALVGEASPRLMFLLESWRKGTDAGAQPLADPTFVAADGARVIRPHFAPLGNLSPAPVLVFLEDTSLLAARVQQSKLAALGRLSASIAHEIRNPVGAMSHAGQLLAESPALSDDDRRLTDIIRANADRVSGIIDNVQRLSRREPARVERLTLSTWTEEFHAEFCETMQFPPSRLAVSGNADLEVRADPDQLRQIVWNLCENAVRHGVQEDPAQTVEIRYGRLPGSARPFLEVADRGPGVKPDLAERIFEPFFTGGRGSGLGLFLARELAQANGATLLFEPRIGGGAVFRLVFADRRRWEV
ncbi:MAG TPA: ATP-binding protein [Steroidobacteraceae bacterium]|nr:ATP-binding protein [Steroidobacteraceae bacterium]